MHMYVFMTMFVCSCMYGYVCVSQLDISIYIRFHVFFAWMSHSGVKDIYVLLVSLRIHSSPYLYLYRTSSYVEVCVCVYGI